MDYIPFCIAEKYFEVKNVQYVRLLWIIPVLILFVLKILLTKYKHTLQRHSAIKKKRKKFLCYFVLSEIHFFLCTILIFVRIYLWEVSECWFRDCSFLTLPYQSILKRIFTNVSFSLSYFPHRLIELIFSTFFFLFCYFCSSIQALEHTAQGSGRITIPGSIQ